MSELSFGLQKGLVGHWTLDSKDTSNGTAYDSSAYDNHATINGATQTSGFIKGAYDFNGSGDYIQTPISGDLANSSYSISLWYNLDSFNTDEIFVGNYDGNGILARVEEGDDYDLWHDSGSIEGGTVTIGEWTHIVYTYDGSNASIYENTVKVVSGSIPDNTNSSDLRIGDTYDNRFYDGQMDDVRIYDRALSESEINALYNMREQRNANL